MLQNWNTMVGTLVQSKDLAFHFEVDPRLPLQACLDDLRLQQMLLNLVSNACKFTKVGFVLVRCQLVSIQGKCESHLRVEVQDSGCGVPLEHQPLLFKAFSQADASVGRKYGGTGLGLSIVKSLAALMDGETGFSSTDRGSCFWFTVPLTQVDAGGLQVELKEPKSVVRHRCTVLVVDDTEMNILLLEHMSRRIGVNLIAFRTGGEAISHLSSTFEMPHFILTDIWMPQMTGFEFASALQEMQVAIPVVAYTADGDPETELKATANGIRKVYQKPLTRDRFIDMCNTFGEIKGDALNPLKGRAVESLVDIPLEK
uniref:histidine kinase n=1 Tax=Eutreptiella gymnastica TaxID=73025 RepID=A0A7S1IR66_9EUGL